MDESIVRHLDVKEEPTRTLKLSEAIRVGASRSRPTHDIKAVAWVEWRDGRCFSCVIGAAWLGATGHDERSYRDSFSQYSNRAAGVSEMLGVSHDVLMTAQRRYEFEGWSRESIADWLESQGL